MDESRFIKSPSEKTGCLSLIIEMIKTIIGVNIIILIAIFRFFIPVKKDLNGEIAVITGAAGYVGRLLALRFAEKGATVVLWDVNKDGVEAVAKEVKENGGHAFPFYCDLRDREDIQRTATKIANDIGNPTILVNNAGIVAGKNLLDLTDNEIKAVFDVNILAHFWTTRAFLPDMMKWNHGHIVSVASTAGFEGFAQLTEYCSSKFAANGFMQSLRREISFQGFDGIHCTTVNPFTIDTELFQGVTFRFPQMPFLEVLKPEYVADKILEAVQSNQAVLHLPRSAYFFPILFSILPLKAVDKIQEFMGSRHVMSTFVGRKKVN